LNYLSDHAEIVSFFGTTPILSCTIRITDRCNLNCIQCYSRSSMYSNSPILAMDQIKSIFSDLKKNEIMRLSITGGEPFTRPDMLDILELASEYGFEIYISTNGTFCDIDFSRFKNINLKIMQISLDGVGAMHDTIRGHDGAFDKSISFINQVKLANSSLSIGVAFTLMKENREHALKLYKYLGQTQTDIFSIIPVQRIGRAVDDYALDCFEQKETLEMLADHYLSSDKKVELNIMVNPALVPSTLQGMSKYKNGYLCTFPYSVAIGADGTLALCDGLLDNKECHLGNVRDGISCPFDSNKVFDILNISGSQIEGICSLCKLQSMCDGGCRADAYCASGKFVTSDIMCQQYFDNGIFPKELIRTESI